MAYAGRMEITLRFGDIKSFHVNNKAIKGLSLELE